jgi:hypothetical protein
MKKGEKCQNLLRIGILAKWEFFYLRIWLRPEKNHDTFPRWRQKQDFQGKGKETLGYKLLTEVFYWGIECFKFL